MGAGLQAHERRVRAQQEHPADGARRAAAYASVVRYSAWPFSDWKFSRNENGFVGSGGRDLNFLPRTMPVSAVRCSSSYGVSGKAVLSYFLRATPG